METEEKTCFVCGKPYISGGSGKPYISGGSGKPYISGGSGKPYISGGTCTIQYYYSPVVANSSNNIITTSGSTISTSNIFLNPTSTSTIGPTSTIVFNETPVGEVMTKMNKNGLCGDCSEEIQAHLVNVEIGLLYKEAMNQVKKDRIRKRGFIYGWEEKRKQQNNTEDNTTNSD